NEYGIEIGTNNNKSINEKLSIKIMDIFKNNISDKVVIDNKFKATNKTLSYYINKKCNINTFQVEVSSKYRRIKSKPVSFNKIINAFIKVIELLEERK
ncbi:MAG: hypothetical protein RSG51_02270, partial [Bacilli bacterium]